MGQLVVGRPAPKQLIAVSAPLALTSAISLTFRAIPVAAEHAAARAGDSLDSWLTDCWRALSPGTQHDLQLLLGFSGRLLYYIEELLFAFDALDPPKNNATFSVYHEFLDALPASRFQEMAANSLVRLYYDRGLNETPPVNDDPAEWRMFLRPGITLADIDEAAALITSPGQLKRRTLALLDGFWSQCYRDEYERRQSELQLAGRKARSLIHPSAAVSFSELTGHRLPGEIEQQLADVERVVYSPSPHLGNFVQYILYRPTLILYFNPEMVLATRAASSPSTNMDDASLELQDALDGLRAISDPTRMKIIEMLREREYYAQEIVGRLGISQSAVSRHLSTLEAAGLISVRPANGMKYYAVGRERLRAIANHLERLAGEAVPLQ